MKHRGQQACTATTVQQRMGAEFNVFKGVTGSELASFLRADCGLRRGGAGGSAWVLLRAVGAFSGPARTRGPRRRCRPAPRCRRWPSRRPSAPAGARRSAPPPPPGGAGQRETPPAATTARCGMCCARGRCSCSGIEGGEEQPRGGSQRRSSAQLPTAAAGWPAMQPLASGPATPAPAAHRSPPWPSRLAAPYSPLQPKLLAPHHAAIGLHLPLLQQAGAAEGAQLHRRAHVGAQR